MSRAKGLPSNITRKKYTDFTKGFYGRTKNCRKLSKLGKMRANMHTMRSRASTIRNRRRANTVSLSNWFRYNGTNYSQGIRTLKEYGLNRSSLLKIVSLGNTSLEDFSSLKTDI